MLTTPQPGHEYTKQNVKFLTTVLQNEAVSKLQSFADQNKETQGKFTIGDEKVDTLDVTFADVRQCLIYDSPSPNARLIGVEYMISAALYKTLDSSERKLWHSHVFEVKSGMLIMPGPNGLPTGVWEAAETKEMEEVVGLYGKTFHFWQVDRGDKLPLGQPQLMMSYTDEEQCPGFKELVGERDSRFQISSEQKKEKRGYIGEPEVHPVPDADNMWKEGAEGEEGSGFHLI
ncbi:MAG: hypothetical protein LQ351_003216 [Letrouitia transgressa]|nr:MAG: hypothetical protein LQ351_003216 [Letrouitia transgressa]